MADAFTKLKDWLYELYDDNDLKFWDMIYNNYIDHVKFVFAEDEGDDVFISPEESISVGISRVEKDGAVGYVVWLINTYDDDEWWELAKDYESAKKRLYEWIPLVLSDVTDTYGYDALVRWMRREQGEKDVR